jgi:hypothetical protein
MSGETLRAPRQQLRRLRAPAFDLHLWVLTDLRSTAIARLSGAHRIFGFLCVSPRAAGRVLLLKSTAISKNSRVIRKNSAFCQWALLGVLPADERFGMGADAEDRFSIYYF